MMIGFQRIVAVLLLFFVGRYLFFILLAEADAGTWLLRRLIRLAFFGCWWMWWFRAGECFL